MIYSYQGQFGDSIRGLIEQKQALGFSYHDSQRILLRFDEFCRHHFPQETVLTKDLALRWAEKRPTESANGFRNRLMPIRELARYLQRLGIDAYVLPPDLAKKGARHVAHIFSQTELSLFFAELDRIPFKRSHPVRHLVLPVFFRLLYCCGLRPFEARRLQVDQVDLDAGFLQILESKGHKDREVPLAADVLALCREYHRQVRILLPASKYFFPSSDGGMYTKEWLWKSFQVLWQRANIPPGSGSHPRPYDFRHTFATRRLYQWMADGKNLAACLPYLSAYLGHAQLSDTAYYIHLTPEFFSQLKSLKLEEYAELLPEVENDSE